MCTYEHCAEGDQQYDNFNDWVSHEVNAHRHEITQTSSPSQEPSEEYHSTLVLSKDSLQPQSSIAPKDISRQECPICLEKNPTFYHIGLHLRRLAIFALPNSVETDEDTIPGDQGSNIADVDEEMSVSSQSISTWATKDSVHEDDDDGEVHEPSPTASENPEDVNLLTHAFRQIEGVIDKKDIERYLDELAPGNTSLSYEESTSASNIHQLDSAHNMSFYVLIDHLEPDYQKQPSQHASHRYWSPPTIRTGYTMRSRSLFHWSGGIMTHISAHEEVGHPLGWVHSAATVFTQNPDTRHLLAVPFDVRQRNVTEYPGAWRPLTFRHIQIANTQQVYSAVLANGDHQHVATRGSPYWMPQLLPRVYDDQIRSTRIQAGLIGSIPLLIALAAFSAPISFLSSVLTNCLWLHRWQPHQYQYPAGRKLRKPESIPV